MDMQTTAATLDSIQENTDDRASSLPWYVVVMALGATSVVVGVIWDISWHKTIGRDTFWTPAHMAIYLGGLIGGLGGGFLALKNTFGRAEDATVRFWGFRAPLGAWMTVWGAIAMLTSAPFDDWWHNAYGLDVEILSPPHTVLASGIIAIIVGALLLALAHHNRTRAQSGTSRGATFLYVSALLLMSFATLVSDDMHPNDMHRAGFYLVACGLFPLLLVGLAHAVRLRWAATTMAFLYTLLSAMTSWILPLFPGEPLLGPIYNPVVTMVPPPFPLLLFVPALAIDLGLPHAGKGFWRDSLLALAMAAGFFVLLVAVHWNFSRFLLSPAANNWFFVGDRFWSYDAGPGPWRTQFWGDPMGARGAALALGIAFLSTRLGLGWGGWMAKVKR